MSIASCNGWRKAACQANVQCVPLWGFCRAAPNLARAVATLDQLTCTTIHGFAQTLIKPYPVEAGIDPGAEIIDPAEADLAFTERLETWLKEQLSDERTDDIVAQLVLADEAAGLALVRAVATFRKANRDARPVDRCWKSTTLHELTDAVEMFRKELDGLKFREATDEYLEAFAALAAALEAPGVAHDCPSPAALIRVLQLARPEACFTGSGAPRRLQAKGKWDAEARSAGASKAEGEGASNPLLAADAALAFMFAR